MAVLELSEEESAAVKQGLMFFFAVNGVVLVPPPCDDGTDVMLAEMLIEGGIEYKLPPPKPRERHGTIEHEVFDKIVSEFARSLATNFGIKGFEHDPLLNEVVHLVGDILRAHGVDVLAPMAKQEEKPVDSLA
jgi:hypothetical protein